MYVSLDCAGFPGRRVCSSTRPLQVPVFCQNSRSSILTSSITLDSGHPLAEGGVIRTIWAKLPKSDLKKLYLCKNMSLRKTSFLMFIYSISTCNVFFVFPKKSFSWFPNTMQFLYISQSKYVKGSMFFSISIVPLFSLSLKLCLTTKRSKEQGQTCCLEYLI